MWVNPKYEYQSTEEAILVKDYEAGNPVFRGEVDLPDKAVRLADALKGAGRQVVRSK